MKKYLTKFSTRVAYEAELSNLDFPNVSYISGDDSLVYAESEPTHDYSLILSNCDPEGDVSNICETQGFCSDSDYYLVLMNGDTIATYEGQTVEYETWGETYHPQLIDPSAGTCVWQCTVIDPSITEVVCYDGNHNTLATLQTSCE